MLVKQLCTRRALQIWLSCDKNFTKINVNVVKSKQINIYKRKRNSLPCQLTTKAQLTSRNTRKNAPSMIPNARGIQETEGMPGVNPSVLSAQVLQHLCRCALKQGFHKRLWGHFGILTYINQSESFNDLLARMRRPTNQMRSLHKGDSLLNNRHSYSSHHNLHKNTHRPHKRNCLYLPSGIFTDDLKMSLWSNCVVC